MSKMIGPRVRDVMFTDVGGRLLLFLFGCNAEAAQVVMSRLFMTGKVSSRSWVRCSDPGQIRQHLESIAAMTAQKAAGAQARNMATSQSERQSLSEVAYPASQNQVKVLIGRTN